MRENRGSQILTREIMNVSKTMADFMKLGKNVVGDISFDPKQNISFQGSTN